MGKRPLCLAGLGHRVQSHPQVAQSLCPPTFQCFWWPDRVCSHLHDKVVE